VRYLPLRVGFSRIWAMSTPGTLFVEDAERACTDTRKHALTIGREIAGYGIDLCFAAVLDRDCGRACKGRAY